MKKYLFVLTVIGLLLGASWVTVAADTVNPNKVLTITPATSRPTIAAGKTESGSFQIINQGVVNYSVKIYATDYTVKGEDYSPEFSPIPNKPDVASWLHFDNSSAQIAKSDTYTVPYAITVPSGTAPGGYYAVAFAETHGADSGTGVQINERVGEIFYIQVAGTVKQAGKLDTWHSNWLQARPLTADLRIENDGGLHYASNVQLVISDIFGRPKYSLPTQKEILPQTIRHIGLRWDKSPPLGLFKVNGSISVPGKTIQLPTKYVLVMAPQIRIIILAVLAIILGAMAGRFTLRHKKQTSLMP